MVFACSALQYCFLHGCLWGGGTSVEAKSCKHEHAVAAEAPLARAGVADASAAAFAVS